MLHHTKGISFFDCGASGPLSLFNILDTFLWCYDIHGLSGGHMHKVGPTRSGICLVQIQLFYEE